MSRTIQNVASVRFEINARAASATMEALQGKADDLNHDIDAVKRNIAELGNVPPEHEGLKGFQRDLAALNKQLKDVQTTMKDYTRGVKAADELLKAAGEGTIEQMSMKAIKAGQNGLKKRIENIQPDTLNPKELEAYRIIKQVIEESDSVVNKFKTDAQQAIQILRDGGNVSERAMRQARDGVKSLMESYEEGSKEHREFAEQYEFLAAKVTEFAEAQRRANGEIVNAEDARRAAVRLTKEGAEAARQETQAQDVIIAQQKEQIRQNDELRQQKKAVIEQTGQQIAKNDRFIDSLQAQKRQMEDDLRVNKEADVESEKTMKTRMENAQKLAETERRTFEESKEGLQKNIDTAKTKVAELKQQLDALGETKVEPKVDTTDIDGLKAKIRSLKDELSDAEHEWIVAAKRQYPHKMFDTYEQFAEKAGEAKFGSFHSDYNKFFDEMKERSLQKKLSIVGDEVLQSPAYRNREELAKSGIEMGDPRLDEEYFFGAKEAKAIIAGEKAYEDACKKVEGAIRRSHEKLKEAFEEGIQPEQVEGIAKQLHKLEELYIELTDLGTGRGFSVMGSGRDIVKDMFGDLGKNFEQELSKAETQVKRSLTVAETKMYDHWDKHYQSEKEASQVGQAAANERIKKTKEDLAVAEGKLEEATKGSTAATEKDTEALKRNADELNRQVEQKKTELDGVDQQVNQLTTDIQTLDQKLKALDDEPIKPKVDTSEIDRLKTKIEQAETRLKESNERLQGLKDLTVIGVDADTKKDFKEDIIREAKFRFKDGRAEKMEGMSYEELLAMSPTGNKEFDKTIKSHRAQMGAWNEESIKLTESYIQSLTNELNTLTSQLNQAQRQALADGNAVEAERQRLMTERDAKQTELNQKQQEQTRLQTEINQKNSEANQLLQEAAEAEQQKAQATEKSAQASADAAEKEAKRQELEGKMTQAKQEQTAAENAYAEAEKKATDAETAATQAKKDHEEVQQRLNTADETGAKILQTYDEKMKPYIDDNERLNKVYEQQEGELQKIEQATEQSNQTILDAEKKKAQARELGAKDMRDAIAAMQQENDAIGESNPKWAENNRLIGQYSQRLEEMKQKSAELRGEIMSLDDALSMADNLDEGASVEKMEQAVKTLTEARRKAVDTEKFDEYGVALDKISAKLKEQTSEWMTLAQAREIAEQAGKNYYNSGESEGFTASPEQIQKATAALERQREVLIKSIKAKRDNKNATEEEKAALKKQEDELQDLTKKLKDLKFEQDNLNMSQEKMQMLMKQPTSAVSLDELRSAIKRADGELKRMEGSMGKNSKEYKNFAEQVKNAKNQLKEMEGQAKATSSAWDKAWSRLKTYVGMYMGFNILWQKMTGTTDDLMTLSDKMGEVRKTTGFTADEVGRLSDNLAKLDTRTALTGLMEFSAQAGSIGLKTQEAVEGYTEAANMLAVSLPEMGNEVSRTLIKISDATGDLEKNGGDVRETLERVGSTIIALRANSAAAASPIVDFVSRVGAVGAQAGISIDQIAALGATIDALGGRVEMSATALSRMIPAIRNNSFAVANAIGITESKLKGMTAMDQMVTIFKQMRDSVKQFDMTTEEGMNGAADAIENMLGKNTTMQEVMKELNQQGARAGIVFGLLSQNVDKLEDQLKLAGEAYRENTALMEEYNKMNDTTAAKWEKLKNQLEEMLVSDSMQRFIGGIIDSMRSLVDFITGNVSPAMNYLGAVLLSLTTAWGVYRLGIASAITAMRDFRIIVSLSLGDIGRYIAAKWQSVFALKAEARAAAEARLATMAATKAMATNAILAFVAAVGMLIYKLSDLSKAAKEAAAEEGRFNQQIVNEQKALNGLFEPLDKSNTAQDERLRLIKEINSKYGQYLGYMLSETSTAIQLADAHALIAKRIKEEAYERRIAEKEAKILEAHSEDVNAAYTRIADRVRGGVKGGANAQDIADMLKGIVDSRMNEIKYAITATDLFGGGTKYRLDPKIKAAIDNGIERLVVDGKLSRDNVSLIQKAVYNYTVEAKSQHDEIMSQTANLRSDLRGVQNAIKVDLTSNLRNLVNNVVNSANGNVREKQGAESSYLGRPEPQGTQLPSLFSGQQGGGNQSIWRPWSQQQQATPQIQKAPEGWKPNVDKKNVEAVKQFVEGQDALRSGLKGYNGAERENAESWLLSDKDLEEYRKIIKAAERANNGGGGETNPYGSYNDRIDPYEQWDANALVARRKEMLERVKALANGADVQAVLSEDKRFMDEATRNSIKNMRDAIAWYNTERLKIQEELHARNLTNTGDWMDPKKGGSKKKPKTPESEGAIAELDRYYSERKELIEEQRSKEEMTEAEYNRRLDALEQEHLTKRSELRQTFTSEDKQFIQQFRQWWASVEELDEVSWTAIEAEWIAAWERDRKYNNREAQKDLTAMQAIVVKQLKEIEAIIDKERPFNGITTNLQNNLTKMGILFKDGVPESDKFMKENTERLTFLLKEAENAYEMTWEQLAEDMRKNGFGTWADAIINSENADKEKRAIIAQLHTVYDAVQDAIKKEAAQVKKQVDITWNDAILPNGKSIKQTYEQAISALGVEQGRVSRANSLIGAGQASERVADKLAIKQMQIQLRMQEHYFNLIHKTGKQRIDDLNRAAEEQRKLKNYAEAEKLELDAKHATMSLNLSLTKEQTELDKQREEIIARTEESQARLYKELREWGELLAASIQGVFEAEAAGNESYYNDLAKLNLTGKGGPGAGTYIVTENAGTSDATAHYEYLDERAALERQHEIEQQNARAEAWKKLMDDLNQKMNDTITDQMNSLFMQANTDATIANTQALYAMIGALGGNAPEGKDGLPKVSDRNPDTWSRNRMKREGMPVAESGAGGVDEIPSQPVGEDNVSLVPQMGIITNADAEMTQENIGAIAETYAMKRIEAEQLIADATAEMPGFAPSPTSITDDDVALLGERLDAMNQLQVDASKKKTDAILADQKKVKDGEIQSDNQMSKSSRNMYSSMMAAANLYGVAYQAMTNDNLSAAQKFEMIALQAAGQSAMAMLQTQFIKSEGGALVSLPELLANCLNINPIYGSVIFAALSALIGAGIGVAASQLSKSKSQIAQTTGASVGAGRLSTGMLTYAEGNVNELTDPKSLTPGRSYNVDGADGHTYRAKYTGTNPSTHLTNGPEFHLAGEKGREAIIDAHTTRLMQMDDTGIWQSIQTLYNGGARGLSAVRRRRGVRAFADGNLDEFTVDGLQFTDDYSEDGGMGAGVGSEQMAAFQSSLDRNNELLERALSEGIHARFDVYGKGGLIDSYDQGKKTVQRHGERY